MCGIVGVTGNDRSVSILIDGLKRLEYRGYDSAGIYVNDEKGMTTWLSVPAASATWKLP
jgi:Glucosamine 6-phosphate synthetase, contains amidotransferase and phosphosugar isomerase domains